MAPESPAAPAECSERHKLIVDLYKRGLPVRIIAEKTGASLSTIYQALRRCGEEPSRKPVRYRGRLTEEELEAIRRMKAKGYSVYRIARELGRPPSTIYYALKRMGLV